MKKLILIVAFLLLIPVIAIAALVLFVNPNQFKPMIVEEAQKHTGLELVIEGDISWQFFPSVGFELGKTELRNPQGYSSANLFKVGKVGIDVSVMPLLDRKLEIGNVTLDGAEFYLETLKDGRKNIDVLTKSNEVAPATESGTATAENASPSSNEEVAQDPSKAWTIQLAGVSVSNALLDVQDHQAGSFTRLSDVSFTLSEFAVEKWSKATFAAKGKNNQQTFSASGSAELKLSEGLAEYALRNIELESSFKEPANNFEKIILGLATFEFDKPNALTYEVVGQAAGLDMTMKGQGELTVDKAISLVQLNKLVLDANYAGDSLPQSPMKVDMASDLRFDLSKSHLNFVLQKLTANAIELDGKADVFLGDIPKVRFALHSPNIDLDEFLGLGAENATAETSDTSDETASQGKTEQSTPVEQEVEPDLAALKTLDVSGDISIDKFKANNAHMQEVQASFYVNRGIAELTKFTSKLYQGTISATAKLDARKSPASYVAKKQIKGVKVQPLLIDVSDNDKLEGTGSIDVDVQGKSLTPTGIQKNLLGTVIVNFADGAVNGINVAQMIRENYAKIKGEKLDDKEGVQKTDFSALTATLKLNKGNVSTDDLQMQSPLLRIRGQGSANYIAQTVDFTVSTSVVGSLEGQGGKDIDELKDVTIPINVSGSWNEPKFKLVFDDVLKQKAKKEIDRGLKKLDEKLGDKIKDEKTKDAINGLIKGLFN
ncbi:AsmA family protein [Vibrio sonorensis]|uniref:AsmA family protein n=1 Tax=Vibrio sonorensis TaxID=1004316 RepID=UPI0008D9BC53|nr:AsmA family protein [Vibrio sonorensis]